MRYTVVAHRVAWQLAYGPIPEGMWVLHRCDNPPCVRPSHLFLGNRSDNIADMTAKGRARNGAIAGVSRGELVGTAKLDEATVRAIRASNLSQRAIAREFGITQWHVWNIRARRAWAHID